MPANPSPVNPGRRALFSLFIFLLSVFLLSIGLSLNAGAQSPAGQPEAKPPRNELGIFAVIPLANGSLKGVTSDRRFYLFGLSYSRLLGHSRVCDVRWTSEIVPVELLSEPFITGTRIQAAASVPPFTETKVTYGMGTNPVGAEVVFLPEKRWQPFTGVHAGISYFTRNALSSHAAQFNFMLDGRAGLRFPLHGGKAISVAYMFQHMSNAYAALENPGVDSHMIHVAYAFPFRFRRAK
ncbi:MAG: acyloxyacyl hydrolase [Acidobacteriia bacterium]|nr:acyloxyacyl hydrolase [Terriglobia bacterium]